MAIADAAAFETMVADIRALAPEVAARSDEIEAGRRIPLDLIARLKAIGVFRIAAPRSHGGLEFSYPDILEIMTEVASLDGSLGWITMLGVGHMPHLALLPRETFDAIYADGPDIIVAGSAAPAGTAEIVDGGYRVSGRWPFGSGCQHADIIFAGVIITKNGEPVMRDDSKAPLMTHVVLPAGDWTIEDTWKVAGLKGTGSHHFRLENVLVPEASTFRYQDDSCLPGPLFGSPFHIIPLLHGAPAIGIAHAALRDLIALASTGKKQLLMNEAMRDSVLFQTQAGELDANLRAARAVHRSQAKALWDKALADGLKLRDTDLLGDCFQNACWITDLCVETVERCYRLGGGSALYSTSSLQRHVRDILAAAQHAAAQPTAYTRSGQMRLGHKVRHPIVD